MEQEREKIKLTNDQWRDLVWELYLIDDEGKEVVVEEVERKYNGSRRHTEEHTLIFQRFPDGKYFKIDYETSVKDEMGWNECNWQDTAEAIEVFPEKKTITIYK